MKNKEINYFLFVIASLIIISSVTNYFLNGDYVSLGIFVFSGLGIISLSIKDKKNETQKQNKYAVIFFSIAAIVFFYWLLASKFNLVF